MKKKTKKSDVEQLNLYRCDKATEIGVTRLASVKCPTGLAFDIERQTCDWKTHVKNCDQLESKESPPNFNPPTPQLFFLFLK